MAQLNDLLVLGKSVLLGSIKSNADHDLMYHGNEFTFASPGYSGDIWINYRTGSGEKDGAITGYRFADGAGNLAPVYGSTFYGSFSGTASSATALTSSAGSTTLPVYFSAGKPVVITDLILTTTSGDKKVQVGNSNGLVELLASTNRGVYDRTKSTWIVYGTQDGTHTYIPRWASKGTSTLPVYFNGNGEPVACGTSLAVSITGNAATATALTSNAGSATLPIYFSGGKPVACNTTLGVSISGTAATANRLALNGVADTTLYGTYAGIIQNSSTGPESGSWHNTLRILHNNSTGYYTDIAVNFTGTHGLWFRSMRSGTASTWYKTAIQNGGNTFSGTNTFNGSNTFNAAVTFASTINSMMKIFNGQSVTSGTVAGTRNALLIYGTTYGNDATYIKTAGKLSYGDPGPQIVFGTDTTITGAQKIALIYTDHDTIAAGNSLSLVSTETNAWFIAPTIKALTKFIGTLDGNAATASKWATARTFSISATAGTTGTSVDGSTSVSLIVPKNMSNFNRISLSTTDNTTSPTAQSIVLNGVTNDTTVAKAPGIGFHIGGITWGSLKFISDGSFRFYNSDCSGYMSVYASTFYGNLSGNASSATYATYLPTSIAFTPAETAITPDNVYSLIGSGGRIKRGTWSYAGNGHIASGSTTASQCPFGTIDLAGTTVIQAGNGSTQYTQIYITPPTASASGAIKGEMIYYINNGTDYTPTWYRVLTDKNYSSILDGRYVNVSGDTMTGSLNMGNNSITNVNNLSFADPGPNEGIDWAGGNGWKIWESPDDLTTNSAGNLQFVHGSTRRLTINTDGYVDINARLVVRGNGSSYNEGIRILPASNGWSNVFFSANTTLSDTHDGGWLIGRRGAAGAVAGAIGDFTIEEQNSNGSNLTIHKDSNGATLQGLMRSSIGFQVKRTNGDGYGLGLYGTSAHNDYGIHMSLTGTYGTYGQMTGDWATYFCFTGANTRGWVFKHAGTNVFSINGKGTLSIGHDIPGIVIRQNHASYDAVLSYQTSGNEAMLFTTKNAVTSFMFVNGEDTVTNVSSTRWTSLTPGLQIKNNCVSIGGLIANGSTPSYKLWVNGTGYFSGHLYANNGLTWTNANWTAPGNIICTANGTNVEFSFDMGAGTQWHVWSTPVGGSILSCWADDRKVKAYGVFEADSYIYTASYLQANTHLYLTSGSSNIYFRYNNTWYDVLKNHNNGNITLNACAGHVFLAYQNSLGIVLVSNAYGASLPTTNLVAGRIFFKLI